MARPIDPLLAHIAGRLERGELCPLSDDDPLERRAGYPGFDPLAAAWLARRYRKAKHQALWVCPPYGDDAMLGRLTYLAVEGLKGHKPGQILEKFSPPPLGHADAWDPEQRDRVSELVDAAYQRVRRVNEVGPEAARPGWWRPPLPSLLALLLLAAAGFGAVTAVRRALRKPAPPPLTGMFASGGRRGDTDPRYDALFGDILAEWTIAMSRVHLARVGKLGGVNDLPGFEAARDAAATRVLAAAAFDAPLAARLSDLLTAARELPAGTDATIAAATAINRELQTRPKPLPYYLDIDIWLYPDERVQLMLLSYAVDGVVFWQVGDTRYSALEVRRLDRLNVVEHNLGYVREGVHHAIILASKIEEELVRDILPALAAQPPAGSPLETLARTLIRDELLPPLRERVGDAGVAALARLGDLVRERAELVAAWQRAAPEGISIDPPSKLSEVDAYDPIAQRFGAPGDRDRLRAIERAIDGAGADARAAWDALVALERASIERHELQHQYDRDHDELPMPEALIAVAGPGAKLARAELSAYLGEIAEGDGGPRERLALLLALVVDADYDGPHKNAAIVAIEQLSGEAVLAAGAVDAARLLGAMQHIAARPRADLQRDARALYRTLFGRDLPVARRL